MPRKVFISILGTGFYEECAYTKEKEEEEGKEQKPFTSTPTRFIQQASLELVGANGWTEEDRVIIFLTKKARELNWNKTITERKRYGKETPEPYKGLEAVLQEMDLKAQVEDKDIKDGMNKEEIWEVFQTIYDTLQEGDELYLDLTHSFRFLPMLLLVLGNYAKFLKGITIKNIVYGNYEARNAQNEAPIISLLPLVSLQDWTFAAANYLQNGRATQLEELANEELRPMLQNTKDINIDARTLNKYVKTLSTFTKDLLNCRAQAIRSGEAINTISTEAKRIEKVIIPAMAPILEKINHSLEIFLPYEHVFNGFYAAQWCFNNQLYQQAITLLQENIVTYICLQKKLDISNVSQREMVNKAFNIYLNHTKEEQWKLSGKNEEQRLSEKQTIRELLEYPVLKELSSTFLVTTNTRNDYNHAGENPNPTKAQKLIDSIECRLKKVFEYFGLPQAPSEKLRTPPHPQPALFVNLSNHPSSTWQPAQLEAAKQYGEIIDIDFPAVDALCMPERVDQLASQYAQDIINKGAPTCLTAHVMGEMTLTFRIVELLKAQGIRCVASTTERIVTDLPDNRKETQFTFVQFREY